MKIFLRSLAILVLVGIFFFGNRSISAKNANTPVWVQITLPNGMSAWHRELPSARTTSIRVCFPAAATLSPRAPALDRILFDLMATAGETCPRARLDRIRDEGAMDIQGSSGLDCSTLSVNTISDRTTDAAALLATLLLRPAQDQAILGELVTRAMNALRWRNGNAWSALSPALGHAMYGTSAPGRYYGLSDRDLSNVTLKEVLAHHKRLLTSGNILIASCGPLPARTMSGILSKHFAGFKPGKHAIQPDETPLPPATNTFHHFPHPAASSAWAKGIFSAPRPGSKDYAAFVLASRIWSEMLMDTVRSRNGLVYSVWASSPSRQRQASAEFVLYRCQNLQRALDLAADSLRSLRKGQAVIPGPGIPSRTILDVLPATKNQILASIALQNITPAERTASFASWFLASGDPVAFEQLPAAILRVTPDEIRTMAQKYFGKMHWGVTLSPQAATNSIRLRWNP